MFINSEWGTVCDDMWDNSDARIVCRSLELSGGLAYSNAYYGQGTGNILMDDVSCGGDEETLFDCRRNRGTHNCNHGEDAAVACIGKRSTVN